MEENKKIDKYIVLDIGGSAIKYGLLNQYGEVLENGNIVTDNDDINKFISDIRSITEKYINNVLLVFSVKNVKSLIFKALFFESISFAGSMDGNT